LVPVAEGRTKKRIREGIGVTWAVLIANSSYTHWDDLDGYPYCDIERIREALERYEVDRVIVEKDITMARFRPLFLRLKEDLEAKSVDSLFIYYAGHGEYDRTFDQGFWKG
jgi:hypothetical protein